MTIFFTIPGEPVAKARPRVTRCGAYTPRKTKNYEALVARFAKAAMRESEMYESGVQLRCTIIIYKGVPKHWSNKKKQKAYDRVIRPTTKPDIDNYVKSITDACNGIIYHDDAQIVELRAMLYYSDSPGAGVMVRPA